ncbi:hypothetical protein MMC17_008296 [Xylographa soralifera]|nr:hypothetical protein [Xylographa soralifera]
MDPSCQQPILQDPFHPSRVECCVTAVRDSAVEEQQLPNRKRYHRNSDETKVVPSTSAVNQGFIHAYSCPSHRKLRKYSSRSAVSSRLHSEDSGDHARYSQEEFLQHPRENSNDIPHMSEVPPDAMFPTPGYGVSVWHNVGDSNGRIVDEWNSNATEPRDLPPIMCAVSSKDTRLRLRI